MLNQFISHVVLNVLSFILLCSLSILLFFSLFLHKTTAISIDSVILSSNHNRLSLLTQWLNETAIDSITLLYRRSRDGPQPVVFHSKCDIHTDTLTVINVSKGPIIGGFTSTTWGEYGFKHDDKSFVFNLSTQKRYEVSKREHAIFASPFFLPIFGERDIFIDASRYVHSAFPRCYGEKSPLNELTSGMPKMILDDLEVFKVHYK